MTTSQLAAHFRSMENRLTFDAGIPPNHGQRTKDHQTSSQWPEERPINGRLAPWQSEG